MGNAAIWWEPKGSQVVRKIDLGARLSDLQVIPARETRTSKTLDGSRSWTRLRSLRRIQVESVKFTSYDLADELLALQVILENGGRISLAEDDSKAWASYCDPWLNPTKLDLMRSPWSLYAGGGVVVGDRIEVSGPTPRMLLDPATIVSMPPLNPTVSGGRLTVSAKRHVWTGESWILARDQGFWPILRLSEDAIGAQIVLHKHRRHFTLSLSLDEDTAGIAALSTTPTVTLQYTSDTGKPTLQAQLAANGAP